MIFLGHVLIDRSNIRNAKKSIDKAAERLKKEKLSIIAFPEGTRTRNGKVLPFKKGLFFLAIQSKTYIVPVSIKGSFEVFAKGTIRSNPGTIHVNVHNPDDVRQYTIENKEKLIEAVRTVIKEDVEKYD